MTNPAVNRAPFHPELQPIRDFLPQLLQILESREGWYGSIYFERKSTRTVTANLKQTNLSDSASQGLVLRIYDGYTLFEQATDNLDPEELKRAAKTLADRVASATPPKAVPRRPYRPPTWQERLSTRLDPEITSQIPAGVTARTQVHFGIRFDRDPTAERIDEQFTRLKQILERLRGLASKHGMDENDLTFAMAREAFSLEEAVFIDRESNMSQTLYRLATTLVTMSGASRTFNRSGGLGGLEAVEIIDSELEKLLRDLGALRSAERLDPGKYRVLFGPVLTGILAHEAFGHSQEADTCARGRSKAWELYQSGERVGNELATILNNPAIFKNADQPYAAWGSYFFDEEGWLAQEQVLLDQGKLKAPMTNLTSAIRLNIPRTANGKRESWASGVYTRQTNTYFSPGDKTLDELLALMGDGFVATEPAGGMEDPKGMGIQVGISFLHEVKNGRFTGKLYRGPAGGDIQLTGYVPDVLNSIVAKSKIQFDRAEADQVQHPFNDAGGCGKYHKELVYAGCGGPYVLLDQVTLG